MVKARHQNKKEKTRKQEEAAQALYDNYDAERELLSKYEQVNYDNYEKTILTLSAAFLAFSVSFLGLFRNKPVPPGMVAPPLIFHHLLIWSWIAFASSILFLLISFIVNAMSNRWEVLELEKHLDKDLASLEKPPDEKASPEKEKMNKWSIVGYSLYALSGASFILGLTLLLIFCARNIHLF